MARLPPEEEADLLVDLAEERGRLRIAVRGASRFGPPQGAALVRQAEEASEWTASGAGPSLGRRAERGGWWATPCEEHERQGTWP